MSTKRKRIADTDSGELTAQARLDSANRLCAMLVAVCNTVSDAAEMSGALRHSLLPPGAAVAAPPLQQMNKEPVRDKMHDDFTRDACALLASHRHRRAPPDEDHLLCRLVARLVTARADLVVLSEYEERVLVLLRRYINVPCEENGDKYYAIDIYDVMRCASYDEVFGTTTPLSSPSPIGTPSPRKRRGVPSPPIRTLCVGCHLIPRHRGLRLRLCGVCDDVGFELRCVLQELVHMRGEFAVHQPRFDQHDELLRAHLFRLQEICVPHFDGAVRHCIRVAQLVIPQ